MQGMTLEKITAACQGVYYGPKEMYSECISMITTDSRCIEKDCLFVAIQGARVDGNKFVPSAYKDGALCCLSEKEPEGEEVPYIVVKSCFQALKDMARLYRESMDIKVIGITGSVGKTTTKEMVASVLSERFCTLKTQGNFNNEVGVPFTLFRLRKEHEVAVVEMGISDFGEMTRLSEMARPDSCIITNIGQCHLENLHDRDGVLHAKTEIFTSMDPTGDIYLNGEDDKLATVEADGKRALTFFGLGNQNKVYAKKIEKLGLKGTKVLVSSPLAEFEVTIPVPGEHMVLNALAAASVALGLGMGPEEIQAGIVKFKPVGGHSDIVETRRFTILNDCYNANPVSMKAGLDVLSEASGRKAAIIGDMFELGSEERQMHHEIGAYAANKGISLFLCIGELAKECYEGAKEASGGSMDCHYYQTKEEALEEIGSLLENGDTVLVKASHGMHFEKIVAELEKIC
ncbi:MAG: UDP-N-acetylmuramoyl-tripeptide--D-alanyl-D-alanine ligase [Lachnospiraceae bacterium]|nr:UDP-N-acetylmuramoyl-tripeptide--D-alanyl-D-alanine ligase [Lachnospiraceae bacterium]